MRCQGIAVGSKKKLSPTFPLLLLATAVPQAPRTKRGNYSPVAGSIAAKAAKENKKQMRVAGLLSQGDLLTPIVAL